MISIWIEIGLESIIAMVNHFPLFALLLRIKDPKRMPGGICIVSVRNNKDHEPIFELRSNAIALGLMFKPYSILLRSLLNNYFSIQTFKKLLFGIPIMVNINKMYFILYSSLPKEPVSLFTLKEQFFGTISENGE